MESKNEQTIADRLNLMIKALNIKKTEVARRIGITDSSVSTMFSGKSNPSTMTINLICKEFGIRTEWLLYGEGEMFGDLQARDVINSFIGSVFHSDDEFKTRFLVALSNLTESDWDTLKKLSAAMSAPEKAEPKAAESEEAEDEEETRKKQDKKEKSPKKEISYEAAKKKALRLFRKANAAADYGDAYCFYDKNQVGVAIGSPDVIVLKDTGEAINVDTYFKSRSDDYVFHSTELEF